MVFRDYVAGLAKFLEENPNSAEFTVIYAADDEGNGFQAVYVDTPTIGHYDGGYKGDFISEDEVAEYDLTVNSICIN